jgi:uncharacterized alkaline shock family protein YloU
MLKNDEENGSVQIADDVVAMIASLAASEIQGVEVPAGNITNELMSKVGVNKLTKGVKVDMAEGKVQIHIAITVAYGLNIPATCHKVQKKVKATVENMTGLECTDVNVRIVAVHNL